MIDIKKKSTYKKSTLLTVSTEANSSLNKKPPAAYKSDDRFRDPSFFIAWGLLILFSNFKLILMMHP